MVDVRVKGIELIGLIRWFNSMICSECPSYVLSHLLCIFMKLHGSLTKQQMEAGNINLLN